jgi:putative permease
MLRVVNHFYQRYFSDPDAVVLVLFLIATMALFWLFGSMLIPAFASIVIAYLLDWFIVRLRRLSCPHGLAVMIVYTAFLSLVLFALLGPIPLLWQQFGNLINELPRKLLQGQALFNQLVTRYPDYFSAEQVENIVDTMRGDITRLGQILFSASLASIPSIIEIVIYLILVPLLVYFFLMDKK